MGKAKNADGRKLVVLSGRTKGTAFVLTEPQVNAGREDDNTICINTKSGHYKPTEWHMNAAKQVFEDVTGHKINVILHMDVDALKAKYGEKYEQMNGICP